MTKKESGHKWRKISIFTRDLTCVHQYQSRTVSLLAIAVPFPFNLNSNETIFVLVSQFSQTFQKRSTSYYKRKIEQEKIQPMYPVNEGGIYIYIYIYICTYNNVQTRFDYNKTSILRMTDIVVVEFFISLTIYG